MTESAPKRRRRTSRCIRHASGADAPGRSSIDLRTRWSPVLPGLANPNVVYPHALMPIPSPNDLTAPRPNSALFSTPAVPHRPPGRKALRNTSVEANEAWPRPLADCLDPDAAVDQLHGMCMPQRVNARFDTSN